MPTQPRNRFNAEDFRDLYKGVKRLTIKEQLAEQIRILRSDAHLECFGKMVCLNHFNHDNLDCIPANMAESYIDNVDLFVTACLRGASLRQ